MATPSVMLQPRLSHDYRRIRALTERLAAPLAPEDQVVQSMPDVSPTKWHLGHVTWFFETFVLAEFRPDYRPHKADWHYLFNSYYYTVGQMHARAERGLLSRPTVREVLDWRARVDDAMAALIARRGDDRRLQFLVRLGLNHEQQHQELLLTDIRHVLFRNPLGPAYDAALPAVTAGHGAALHWVARPGGPRRVGAEGDDFCFDNETPRHEVMLGDHELGSRLVTNAEFARFIDDGGYTNPALWLADGWSAVLERGWSRPLYWSEDRQREFTLGGWRELVPDAPVTCVSFYEADAFARWAGARLPTEAEWEAAAAGQSVTGNFVDDGLLQAAPGSVDGDAVAQLYGDAWEWTASPYTAYPGFRPLEGSLGEYNGKFMCNQLVVRGGSWASSADHLRASYRSFFYPHQRWQVLGFRLARDR